MIFFLSLYVFVCFVGLCVCRRKKCVVLLGLPPCHLTSTASRRWACVFCEHMRTYATPPAMQSAVSVSPCKFYSKSTGVAAKAFHAVTDGCGFILVLYVSMPSEIGIDLIYQPLLPIIFKCVCVVCTTLCIASTVEFGRCSVACGLVSIGGLWGMSATVDSASIDWCDLNPVAQSSTSIYVFPCLLVRGHSI